MSIKENIFRANYFLVVHKAKHNVRNMKLRMSTQNFQNMEAKDWLHILQIYIASQSTTTSPEDLRNDEIIDWLNATIPNLDHAVNAGDLASIRKSNTRRDHDKLTGKPKPNLTKFQDALVTAISEIVPLTCILDHLLDLRYRSLAYYKSNTPSQQDPSGIYISRRLSFSSPGKLCQSAFWFYEKNGRLEFKEKRFGGIENEKYQIRTKGFWFHEKGAYRLNGISCEIPLQTEIHDLFLSDINNRELYDDNYILNNNRVPTFIDGIASYILKGNGWSAATKTRLNKLDNQPTSFEEIERIWKNIHNTEHVFQRRSVDLKKLKALQFNGNHTRYKMPVIENN